MSVNVSLSSFQAAEISYLHDDEAGKLQVSLHHGESSQKVFTLGDKVGEFPRYKSNSEAQRQEHNDFGK